MSTQLVIAGTRKLPPRPFVAQLQARAAAAGVVLPDELELVTAYYQGAVLLAVVDFDGRRYVRPVETGWTGLADDIFSAWRAA